LQFDLARLMGLVRSRAALEAEILVLGHQLNVLRRKSPQRVALNSIDRLLLVGLYRLAPGVLDALKIVRPETLMSWPAPASEPIGAGNPDRSVAGQRQTSAASSAR
jgi:hypothetical protein